jgi:hypothetical protein
MPTAPMMDPRSRPFGHLHRRVEHIGLFVVDRLGVGLTRLLHSATKTSPSFSPAGRKLLNCGGIAGRQVR